MQKFPTKQVYPRKGIARGHQKSLNLAIKHEYRRPVWKRPAQRSARSWQPVLGFVLALCCGALIWRIL